MVKAVAGISQARERGGIPGGRALRNSREVGNPLKALLYRYCNAGIQH